MEHSNQQFWEAIDKVQESELCDNTFLTIEKATELSVWLHTEYQCKMEEAESLFEQKVADEGKPFEEKYKARAILQNLRENEYMSEKYTKMPSENMDETQSQGSDVMRCALGLVMHKLGLNFYETEEISEALVYLKKSFELMDSIPDNLKLRHLNAVQDLYNHIGIILSDREKSDEALAYLQKAQEIYQIVVEHTKDLPQKTVMKNFDLFLLKKSKGESENFSFFINSGLDLKKLEQKYTTTLFILAQVHSKLSNIDLGMKYCGITMQRQLSANDYELKDWVVNATTLAEAFLSREHFSQAEYLLYAAYHVLPEDMTKKKGLRAMVRLQLARYYQKRLDIGVQLYIENLELDLQKVQQKFVEFPELEMNWPEIKNLKGMDDAKTLFKLSNTQFKKALEYYVLDGFVTEHVQAQQGISMLYKYLSKIEQDKSRVILMHNRRIESLEYLQSQLNPNAYQIRMMEFGAELSDIYGDLYEIEFKKPKKSMDNINIIAQKAITNANVFTSIVYGKEDIEKFEYLTTMLNLELSVASKLTKWFTSEGSERIAKTKEALEIYKKLDKFVEEYMKYKGFSKVEQIENPQVQQQINIVREMKELLPQKLDKMAKAL